MLLALLLLACDPAPPAGGPAPDAPPDAPARDPIRIGWQTTWATQGQLSVVLQKTNILEMSGFDAEFVGFTYGGPLNEGALAGEVDVLFTADQPAIALMARSPDWGVIGRLMYNRVGTFVPPKSPVKVAADLRGKTIAIPFGAAAHRETLRALEIAKLDPAVDVNAVNLGIQELVALVGRGAERGRWGTVDAGSAWDPAYADMEHGGRVRTVASGLVTSLVVMNEGYLRERVGAERRFMAAMVQAYDYYRTHRDEVDRWFLDAAKLNFDPEVLQLAASVEPNLEVDRAEDIRLWLTAQDISNVQGAADFMHEAKLLKQPFSVGSRIHRNAAKGAEESRFPAPVVVR